MATYRSEAIVLKRRDSKEYDRLLTIFTKNKGKVDLVAKGVKKIRSKMAGHLEPFGVVDIMVARGKAQDRVAGTKLIENFPYIKLNIESIALVGYFNEAVDCIIHGNQSDPKVFQIIVETYHSIDQYLRKNSNKANIQDQILITLSCILKLCSSQGFTPSFYTCFYCKKEVKEETNFVSQRHLSVVCPLHRNKEESLYPVSSTALKVLRLMNQESISTLKLNNLNPEISEEIRKIVNAFILMIGEKQINSYSFLSTLISK